MSNWKHMVMKVPGARALSAVRTQMVARWFDFQCGVKTCGVESPHELTVVGGDSSHAIPYIPTSPSCGRHMLGALPVADVSEYTFIDMGSGKGRMLLLAAELPFRRIVGVEFASELDAVARSNVASYRNRGQRCFQIETINQDATQYEFPSEPLVIYFFYPFDEVVMRPVMENLDRSIAEHPRDVVLVYRNPVLAGVVEEMRSLRVIEEREYFGSPYNIYRSAFGLSIGLRSVEGEFRGCS